MSGTNTPDEHERLELPPAVGVGAGQGGDYKAFGLTETYNAFLPMLEIQFRTGDRSAFAYHTLGRAEFSPGTTLHPLATRAYCVSPIRICHNFVDRHFSRKDFTCFRICFK